MRCRYAMVLLSFLSLGILGCSDSPRPDQDVVPEESTETTGDEIISEDTSDPTAAVSVFLDSLCRGDDKRIMAMYSALAQEQTRKYGGDHFSPKGSDTRRFEIGQVEYLAQGGARVHSVCTDLGEDGKPHSDKIVWMLRKEPEGWRVAGMAATVFPGEPPILLDFEDLQTTLAKIGMVGQEIRRRNAMQDGQVRQSQAAGESVHR